MALNDYRDKNGELSGRHRNTLVGCASEPLRFRFRGRLLRESDRLMDGLDQLDDASLNKLAHDQEAGKLARIFCLIDYATRNGPVESRTRRRARLFVHDPCGAHRTG
jgi:hypothetical protein